MIGFMLFSSQNDLFYIYSNEAFREHMKSVAASLGLSYAGDDLLTADNRENYQSDNDVIVQIFSPLIASQTVMEEQFHNPYSLVVCEDGTQIALQHQGGYIIVAVCKNVNLHASHLLAVGLGFVKNVCGPALVLLKISPAHTQMITLLLSQWLQLREKDLSVATESLNFAEFKNETSAAATKILSQTTAKFSSAASISLNCVHVAVFHQKSIVGIYSGKGAAQLNAADILFLKILSAGFSRSTSLHSHLILLEDCVPYTIHIQNLTSEICAVVLIELGMGRLSRSVCETLALLESSTAGKASEMNKNLKNVQTGIKNAKFDLKDPLVYKENHEALLSRQLLQIFQKICLDPCLLFTSVNHIPSVMESLEKSLKNLEIEKMIQNQFQRVLEQYEGLVHFVFIDRTKGVHKMIAPDLPALGSDQTSDTVWHMFHTSMDWLCEGRLHLLWNDKQFCYSHFLWLENEYGENLPWSVQVLANLQNGGLGYPGVMNTTFYEKLMEMSGSEKMNCYQLFCVHLGVTSPAEVVEQSRNLARHLTKYLLPKAIQDLL